MTDPSEDSTSETDADGAGDASNEDRASSLLDADERAQEVAGEKLHYPTVEFNEGEIASNGAFELSKPLDRNEMAELARNLAGALSSHDFAVETPDGFTTLGIAPKEVEVSFDPGEDHRGDLELKFRLSGKTMFVSDTEIPKTGSRGGSGFVPLRMLAEGEGSYRCYGWVGDPENPE